MIPTKEDMHTEFKTSFNEEVIVTLVTFANSKGGRVYVSTPRNKQVARLFKEMGEIERYGTGIKRVCDMFVNENK